MKGKPRIISLDNYFDKKMMDPEYRRVFLQVAIEDFLKDGDKTEFLCALKAVAEAKLGIAKLAKKTGLSRQALYKIFSEKGNPEFGTIVNILDKLGMTISFGFKK